MWKSTVYTIEIAPNKWILFSTQENKVWIYRRNRITKQYSPKDISKSRLVCYLIDHNFVDKLFLEKIFI